MRLSDDVFFSQDDKSRQEDSENINAHYYVTSSVLYLEENVEESRNYYE